MKSTKEYRLFGNLIQFRGLDDSQKVRGAERDILFINEANEVDQETFTQLNMRTKVKVIVDYNPSEEFWTEDLKLRDNSAFFITTFRNNPYLGQAQIDEIQNLEFTNPSLYKIYGLGLFADIEGLVYTNWAAATKFPADCRNVGYGLDFGFSNDVTALVKCGIWGGEIYAEEKIYQTGLTNLDLNKLLKDPAIIDNRRIPIIADPGGGGAMNIEELRRMGWNIHGARKGAGSISFGISMVQPYKLNLIGENIIKERKNYAYVKDKRGGFLNEPVDRWNHGMDGLRYWGIENLSTPVIVQRRRVAGI
jgi:phage terminase large subunit